MVVHLKGFRLSFSLSLPTRLRPVFRFPLWKNLEKDSLSVDPMALYTHPLESNHSSTTDKRRRHHLSFVAVAVPVINAVAMRCLLFSSFWTSTWCRFKEAQP